LVVPMFFLHAIKVWALAYIRTYIYTGARHCLPDFRRLSFRAAHMSSGKNLLRAYDYPTLASEQQMAYGAGAYWGAADSPPDSSDSDEDNDTFASSLRKLLSAHHGVLVNPAQYIDDSSDDDSDDEENDIVDERISFKDEGIFEEDEGIFEEDEGIFEEDEGIFEEDEGISSRNAPGVLLLDTLEKNPDGDGAKDKNEDKDKDEDENGDENEDEDEDENEDGAVISLSSILLKPPVSSSPNDKQSEDTTEQEIVQKDALILMNIEGEKSRVRRMKAYKEYDAHKEDEDLEQMEMLDDNESGESSGEEEDDSRILHKYKETRKVKNSLSDKLFDEMAANRLKKRSGKKPKTISLYEVMQEGGNEDDKGDDNQSIELMLQKVAKDSGVYTTLGI